MKRLALLLPLLALAAAPARAADPATNAAGQIEDPISDLPPKPKETQEAEAVRDLHPRGSRARSPDERERALARWGAFASASAVPRALRWLKTQQLDDGSWPGNPVASTALALWTYLDHGDLPGGNAEFGPTIERAVRFLAEDVDPDTGLFRSARGEPLAQPLGFFALALYVKETSNPPTRFAAAAACRPLFAGQRPDGAWNADPLDPSPDGLRDLRSTVWCALALRGALQRHFDFGPSGEDAVRHAFGAVASFLDPATGVARRPDGTADPATAAAAFALDEFDRDDPIAKKAVAFLAPCTVLWTAWEDSQPWTAGDAPVRDWFFVTCAKYGTNPDFPDWNKWFFPAFLQRQTIVKAAESGYEDAEGKPRDVAWWDSPSAEERGVCSGGPVLSCKRWRGGESFDGETTLGDRVRDTCLCALSLMVYYSDPSAASHFEEEVSFLRPKKSDDIPVSVHRKTERQGSDARVIQTPHPAEPEPHAESAEWRPTPEQTGRFRFDDQGKVVVAEVDAEGRVRLLENGPDSPPLRIRPATIRNRNLFVVEMDDIPDTGRHWMLALDFDVAKRAWIVVGEGETAADIVPEKPGYRTALFRRLDEPPSAPVP